MRANVRVFPNSYNRYLAIAARTIRRSLKEDKRIAAERRGESDLRFIKWEVCKADALRLAGRLLTVNTATERQAR